MNPELIKAMADVGREEHGKFSTAGLTPEPHAQVLRDGGYKFSHVNKKPDGNHEDVWKHPVTGASIAIRRSGDHTALMRKY